MANASHSHARDKWERRFHVTDHIKHKSGFTLYKITSIVYPKCKPEAGSRIIVWKRFNDIKTLHKELKKRHAELRIGEDFPKLAKSRYFSRFSEEVIKERKEKLGNLLDFVAKYPCLFTADVFVKFFKGDHQFSEYDLTTTFSLHQSQMGQNQSDGSLSEESDEDRTRDPNSIIYGKLKKDFFKCEFKNAAFASKISSKAMPDYWEEANAHADEAHHQEVIGNYEVAFAIYKTAIVCLLSGVQSDRDGDNRVRVKEKTSEYLMRAEWIYNNYLVFRPERPRIEQNQIPWRSRSQLKRYKVVDVLCGNLLVRDVTDDILVVVKGVLKSAFPYDRSEMCVLPKDAPYMVKLYALHETETTVFFILEHVKYGKLWDHLEHYFKPGVTRGGEASTPGASTEEGDSGSAVSEGTTAAPGSCCLSRLESSCLSDTLSCDSLGSQDDRYFDLVEDYVSARTKNKMREIDDFNRRRLVEASRLKKTASQADLKALTEGAGGWSHSIAAAVGEVGGGRRRSLSDLTRGDDETRGLGFDKANGNDAEECTEDTVEDEFDTCQLLRNAQKLIESIDETLKRNDVTTAAVVVEGGEDQLGGNAVVDDGVEEEKVAEDDGEEGSLAEFERAEMEVEMRGDAEGSSFKEGDDDDNGTPASEFSIPTITEEYSATAAIQRTGVTGEKIRAWACQMLLALEFIHQRGIVCGDFNPGNVLLSDNGSAKLTFFYRYTNVDGRFSTQAREGLYTAPEVRNCTSTATFASDWWSYGAVMYELITAAALRDSHPMGINSHTTLDFPSEIKVVEKSFLTQLLKYEPSERLGGGECGAEDVKMHAYFDGIDWEQF